MKGWKLLLSVVTLVLILLWGATPFATLMAISYLTSKPLFSFDASLIMQMGQTGDLFGSINALFTALAFGGLILTIHYQHLDSKDRAIETAKLHEIQDRTAKAQERAATMNAFSKLIDIADNKDVTTARLVVNKLRPRKVRYTKHEEGCIKTVLRAYNVAGIFVKRGLIPQAYFVEEWAPHLRSSWETLEPWIDEQIRIRDDRNHWVNYRSMALAALELPVERPTDDDASA